MLLPVAFLQQLSSCVCKVAQVCPITFNYQKATKAEQLQLQSHPLGPSSTTASKT